MNWKRMLIWLVAGVLYALAGAIFGIMIAGFFVIIT